MVVGAPAVLELNEFATVCLRGRFQNKQVVDRGRSMSPLVRMAQS